MTFHVLFLKNAIIVEGRVKNNYSNSLSFIIINPYLVISHSPTWPASLKISQKAFMGQSSLSKEPIQKIRAEPKVTEYYMNRILFFFTFPTVLLRAASQNTCRYSGMIKRGSRLLDTRVWSTTEPQETSPKSCALFPYNSAPEKSQDTVNCTVFTGDNRKVLFWLHLALVNP